MIHHKGDGWWGIRKPDIQFRMPGFRFRSSRERMYAFPTRDVERSRERDFAKLNLHLPACRRQGHFGASFGKDAFWATC